jgi:hypothetical protein
MMNDKGYRPNQRAKLAWTDKAQRRFKERVREITSRNRGYKVETVIDELKLYIRGWVGCLGREVFGIDATLGDGMRELAVQYSQDTCPYSLDSYACLIRESGRKSP